MKDTNTALGFSSHSLDCDSVSFLHLGCPLKLMPFLVAKHPTFLLDKSLILVVLATPRRANNPVFCHLTTYPEKSKCIKPMCLRTGFLRLL